MDLKITSINFDIMKKALEQAKDGRLHILGKMADAIKAPRKELSKYAPTIKSIEIPTKKIREVIGSGGTVIREIQEKTGTKIDIEDSGKVNVSGTSAESIEAALAIIHDIVSDPEVGKVYTGKVVRIMDMGAIVEFGRHDGMVHISEISKDRVAKVEDKLKIGDEVKVLLLESREGKNKLSIKKAK
jgi:polyribonucleotide nucleotidyltransferase